MPAAFHANFLAAMRFLSDLEAMCQGRTALDRLRGSSAYSTFLKRWNLSVYFSLLYQEIAGIWLSMGEAVRCCRWCGFDDVALPLLLF